MNRPERICINENGFERGYNIACDDWEAYLPTEQEIERIILEWEVYSSDRFKLAKAIHDRISQ